MAYRLSTPVRIGTPGSYRLETPGLLYAVGSNTLERSTVLHSRIEPTTNCEMSLPVKAAPLYPLELFQRGIG
jgi:hypothetical protein